MRRPGVQLFLKVLVSLGLLLFLFSRINIAEMLRVLSSAHLSYVAMVLTLYFLGQAISSMRWALLAWPLGFKNSFKDFFVFYFIGMFFNLFAPSTIGGDVGRVLYLARDKPGPGEGRWSGRMGTALTTVIADRTIGMAVLVWIAVIAVAVFPVYPLPRTVRYVTFGLALGVLLGWLLLPWIRRTVERRVNPLGRNLALALDTYASQRRIIAQTVVLSLVIHFSQAISHVLVGWSLGFDIPWSYSFILYPLVGLFIAIPISFNGIGLREGGYLFMLQQIDVSSEKAVAFGLLWFIIVAMDSMIGGVMFVVRKNRRARSSR